MTQFLQRLRERKLVQWDLSCVDLAEALPGDRAQAIAFPPLAGNPKP